MISEYNRTNPFLHVLQEKEKQLEIRSANAIRQLIFCIGLAAITIVLSVIADIITTRFSLITYILLFVPAMAGIFYVRIVVRSNKKAEVNEIMLSDKFENINLNNEKLFMESLAVSYAIGRIDETYSMLSVFNIVYLCYIVQYMIRIATAIW